MSLENKSYTTIAEADEYWLDRNDADWAGASEAEKTAALIRATEWIDNSFDWVGTIKTYDQVLAWPRAHAVDKEYRLREGIPDELKNAVAWLAKNALTAEIDPPKQRGGDIQRVKAASVEVEWNPNAPTGTTYSHVFRILKNIVIGSPNQMKLTRS